MVSFNNYFVEFDLEKSGSFSQLVQWQPLISTTIWKTKLELMYINWLIHPGVENIGTRHPDLRAIHANKSRFANPETSVHYILHPPASQPEPTGQWACRKLDQWEASDEWQGGVVRRRREHRGGTPQLVRCHQEGCGRRFERLRETERPSYKFVKYNCFINYFIK